MKTPYNPKLRAVIIPVIVMLFLLGCGSTNTNSGRVENWDDLVQLVNSRNFKIENNWANPLGGGRIEIMTNINFIKFKGDSVEVFLPYFGVRHSGGGYGKDNGIQYEGLIQDLQITENPDKKRILLEFNAKEDSENLDFNIQLYASGKSYTSVNSSQRSNISYDGNVMLLDKEDNVAEDSE